MTVYFFSSISFLLITFCMCNKLKVSLQNKFHNFCINSLKSYRLEPSFDHHRDYVRRHNWGQVFKMLKFGYHLYISCFKFSLQTRFHKICSAVI